MKTILLHLVGCVFTLSTFAQGAIFVESYQDCANVTKKILTESYDNEQLAKLEVNPEKLSKMNYVLSSSYFFAPDQMVLNSQKTLFDVRKFEHLRKETTQVTVYDEETGLTVTLKSHYEMDKELSVIEGLALVKQK